MTQSQESESAKHRLASDNPRDKPWIKFESVQKFSSKGAKQLKKELTAGQYEAFKSYQTLVIKTCHTKKFKDQGLRVNALNELGKRFATGWPWRQNSKMTELATPTLVDMCYALASQIVDIEKARIGKDVGRID